MIKIVILTATRAEYGLLKPLIKKINDDNNFGLNSRSILFNIW